MDLLPYRYQRRPPFFFPAMKSAFCCKLPWRYRPRTVSQNHTQYCLDRIAQCHWHPYLRSACQPNNERRRSRKCYSSDSRVRIWKISLGSAGQIIVKAPAADYREKTCSLPERGRHVPHWFVNGQGKQVRGTTFDRQFRRLTDKLGIRARNGQRPPRLHDLRHRSAISNLLLWYRDGSRY